MLSELMIVTLLNRPNKAIRGAVCLDRDGTIIHDPGYLSDPRRVRVLPGAIEALRLLESENLLLVLISNQSGVGRGMFTHEDLNRVHERLVEVLAGGDVTLSGAYYCVHSPWEECSCRKPNPGMLLRAAFDLGLDLSRSYMVGDSLRDVIAGRLAGCRTVLLSPHAHEVSSIDAADAIASDLLAATRWIIADVRAAGCSRR
jgi:D-glycero-D-manno-heptose 1,7-bisphosphate phosphatase